MEYLRGVRQALTQEKAQLTEEQKELKAKLEYLKDPNYQKHLIHKELGYVEEDEVVVQFPKKN